MAIGDASPCCKPEPLSLIRRRCWVRLGRSYDSSGVQGEVLAPLRISTSGPWGMLTSAPL